MTEEIIYRGLVVSGLRRIGFCKAQLRTDLVACAVSALLFGVAHAGTWGLPAALAIMGLGFGFGVGYIAAGERLIPVIIYHFAFDFLSLVATLFIN